MTTHRIAQHELGDYARQQHERENHEDLMPLFGILFWAAVGLGIWVIGGFALVGAIGMLLS